MEIARGAQSCEDELKNRVPQTMEGKSKGGGNDDKQCLCSTKINTIQTFNRLCYMDLTQNGLHKGIRPIFTIYSVPDIEGKVSKRYYDNGIVERKNLFRCYHTVFRPNLADQQRAGS